jgi:hypothetical protein
MMERMKNVLLFIWYTEIDIECVQQLNGLQEALDGSLGEPENLQ